MVPLIPREVLFGNPDRVMPRLSPDGTRLAWIAPDEGVLNVWVKTVGGDDARPVTRDRGRGIRSYSWAEDDRHLLYVQDRDGDENWHLYRVGDAGGDDLDLTPVDGVQARIVATEKGRPDEILVGINDRDPRLHDVWRVRLSTGERELVEENRIGAIDFWADHTLAVRVGMVPTPDGGFRILHRLGPLADWEELFAISPEDSLTTHPLAFAADNRRLWVSSSTGSDTAGLRCLETDTGRETPVAAEEGADLHDVFFHPDTWEPQAVVFWKDRQAWRVLDDSIAGEVRKLEGLAHGDLHVVDRDRADRVWLTAHSQDRGPVLYHSFDRLTGEAEFLFSSRPALEDQPLVEMRPVSFTARDGLVLNGYLSLPAGAEPKGLPAVLDVHGGPWHRDYWGFDPEAQWLANRGYACLQVNFRGSTGYGKAFVNAGDREWGGKMQDDLTDAVEWLVAGGIADPDRIGIYGGSYGGYAVLAGLTRTPDLYRCGVDIVGPSNLITFSRSIPPYWEPLRALFRRRVGDVDAEEDFLRSRSPLFAADRIRAPLLIVQGKNDPRVNREESLQIVAALEKAGRPVEFLEFADEGHGFARPENRLVFYAKAERFLAEHLGGRSEE